MINDDRLNDLGSTIMKLVRDRSIDKFDGIRSGSLRSQRAIELHKLLSSFDEQQKEIIKTLVIECVDNTIFNFLFMFEEDQDKELFVSGINANDISDGLSGELFTEDGWIAKFSKNP